MEHNNDRTHAHINQVLIVIELTSSLLRQLILSGQIGPQVPSGGILEVFLVSQIFFVDVSLFQRNKTILMQKYLFIYLPMYLSLR